MPASSSTPEPAPASESWAKAHPWLTTWIALSTIAGAVQIVDILTGKRPALRLPRQSPPAPADASAPDAKASAARPFAARPSSSV